MDLTGPYPAIPLTREEQVRETRLWTLARAFQAEMEELGNPCILKGGTALRFRLGLPRPSTDLDFDGDQPLNIRRTMKRVLERAGLDRTYKAGRDWRGVGTVNLQPRWRARLQGTAKSKIDYRYAGQFPGQQKRTPIEKSDTLTRGIRIYTDTELAGRKLTTITGERPRFKARDLYDAGWLVTEHPDLIGPGQTDALKGWISDLHPDERAEHIADMNEDRVIRRAGGGECFARLERGIALL